MIEVIVIFGLLSPFLLMIWMVSARNRARAQLAEKDYSQSPAERFATEEMESDEDGLSHGRQQAADHELIPPDSSGGEHDAIRALQGRR